MKLRLFRNAWLIHIFVGLTQWASIWLGMASDCDLLLRDGFVHVGDGSEGFLSDVAIREGRIIAIGRELQFSADQVLNCESFVICPGFIDLHTHSDEPILERDTRANIKIGRAHV